MFCNITAQSQIKVKRCTIAILLLFLTVMSLEAQEQYPSPVGYVNDFADVISPEYEAQITNIAKELEGKASAEIAVATIRTVGNEEYRSYANKLFERWKIGKKGKDNGILIFVTVGERKLWIEVGYGLEGILPDGLVGEIEDRYMLPYLKSGDYGRGLIEGTRAVASVIAKDAGVKLDQDTGIETRENKTEYKESTRRTRGSRIPFFVFFIIIMIIISILDQGRRGGRRGIRGGGFWSGGGFGGGFGGGGFGGFGGGSSGGGGAGRSF